VLTQDFEVSAQNKTTQPPTQMCYNIYVMLLVYNPLFVHYILKKHILGP